MKGRQAGDFICFNKNDLKEHVSPVHMRSSLSSIRLKVGDFLYSNYRNHLMQLVEDSVGKHDFFFPACDYYRYKVDFGIENHPHCHDNLVNALKKCDIYEEGITARICPVTPGRANLVACLPGQLVSAKQLMYVGHLDTVTSGELGWSYDPFAANETDGLKKTKEPSPCLPRRRILANMGQLSDMMRRTVALSR